jgi:hypothetical protein
MTGTASTVKYHVSDFLQDQHPYNAEQSWGAQATREKGKVFNGFLPGGLDKLLDALEDEGVQKAIALRHLHAHSAAAEKRIVLLRRDVTPRLVALLQTMEQSPLPVIEQLCMQLLRSLCILRQGANCVIAQGGQMALTLSNRKDAEDRDEARVSAASACSSSPRAGRAERGFSAPTARREWTGRTTRCQSGRTSMHLSKALCPCGLHRARRRVSADRVVRPDLSWRWSGTGCSGASSRRCPPRHRDSAGALYARRRVGVDGDGVARRDGRVAYGPRRS